MDHFLTLFSAASGGSLFAKSPENVPVAAACSLIPAGLREKAPVYSLNQNPMLCNKRWGRRLDFKACLSNPSLLKTGNRLAAGRASRGNIERNGCHFF